ncbi:hypothetical protein LY85_0890 [Clostridium sp. KNHs216]|nr:hypothetical protein LY85_0890 [Clostridium sp. KNHs216]
MRLNESHAMEYALKLVEKNIESTPRWIEAEEVTQFLQTVYSYLSSEVKASDESM